MNYVRWLVVFGVSRFELSYIYFKNVVDKFNKVVVIRTYERKESTQVQ